jgi:hypothetical protein
MSETTRYGLRFPDLVDTPDGPAAFEELAEDVEGWLSRALPCTSITRPTPVEGLIIRESDTGAVYVASGAGAWDPIGTGGGSGSSSGAAVQYSAATNQSIANSKDTAILFGSGDRVSPEVTRLSYRPDASQPFGNSFQINASGIWAISTTVRYASVTFDGERYAGIHLASTGEPLVGSGWRFEVGLGGTQTLTCSVAGRWFDPGDQVYVHTRQQTGGSRTLERGTNGGWVRINLARVG